MYLLRDDEIYLIGELDLLILRRLNLAFRALRRLVYPEKIEQSFNIYIKHLQSIDEYNFLELVLYFWTNKQFVAWVPQPLKKIANQQLYNISKRNHLTYNKTLMNFVFAILAFNIATISTEETKSYPNYTLTMTFDAFRIMDNAYIDQIRNKTCRIQAGGSRQNCQLYCRLFYAYVPALPQKNLAGFDKQTRKCVPKKFCPPYLGVDYEQKTDKCYDSINGKEVPPLQPRPPNSALTKVINVTFFCKYGKVITFNGFPDCQCFLGYKTQLSKFNGGQNQNVYQAIKCNEEAKLYEYFPDYFKVKYDPERDNRFPFAWDQDYWVNALFYYLRKLKYAVETYFEPWEAQIFTIAIPKEDTIREEDYRYIFWFLVGLGIVVLLSFYQKNMNGRVAVRENYQERIGQDIQADLQDQL